MAASRVSLLAEAAAAGDATALEDLLRNTALADLLVELAATPAAAVVIQGVVLARDDLVVDLITREHATLQSALHSEDPAHAHARVFAARLLAAAARKQQGRISLSRTELPREVLSVVRSAPLDVAQPLMDCATSICGAAEAEGDGSLREVVGAFASRLPTATAREGSDEGRYRVLEVVAQCPIFFEHGGTDSDDAEKAIATLLEDLRCAHGDVLILLNALEVARIFALSAKGWAIAERLGIAAGARALADFPAPCAGPMAAPAAARALAVFSAALRTVPNRALAEFCLETAHQFIFAGDPELTSAGLRAAGSALATAAGAERMRAGDNHGSDGFTSLMDIGGSVLSAREFARVAVRTGSDTRAQMYNDVGDALRVCSALRDEDAQQSIDRAVMEVLREDPLPAILLAGRDAQTDLHHGMLSILEGLGTRPWGRNEMLLRDEVFEWLVDRGTEALPDQRRRKADLLAALAFAPEALRTLDPARRQQLRELADQQQAGGAPSVPEVAYGGR